MEKQTLLSAELNKKFGSYIPSVFYGRAVAVSDSDWPKTGELSPTLLLKDRFPLLQADLKLADAEQNGLIIEEISFKLGDDTPINVCLNIKPQESPNRDDIFYQAIISKENGGKFNLKDVEKIYEYVNKNRDPEQDIEPWWKTTLNEIADGRSFKLCLVGHRIASDGTPVSGLDNRLGILILTDTGKLILDSKTYTGVIKDNGLKLKGTNMQLFLDTVTVIAKAIQEEIK
jgi:hypothetical protein